MVSDYETLGVSIDASPTAIRKAFASRLVAVHPGRNPGNEEWANQMTKRAIEAYERLCLTKNGLESKVISTVQGSGRRFIQDEWNSRPQSDEPYWRSHRHSAEAVDDRSKRVLTSHPPFWDRRGESEEGCYSVGYTLIDDAELPELPLGFDSEAFYMDIFPMCLGKVYFIGSMPTSFTEAGLEASAFLVRQPVAKISDLATLLINNKTMHEFVAKATDVRPLDYDRLCHDMGRILPMGFKWYHSRWGTGFVPVNSGGVFQPKGGPLRFDGGVRCKGGCNRFYTVGLMGAYHNLSGFNLYDNLSPMMGILMDNGQEVGIYLEQDAMPGTPKQEYVIQKWKPEAVGKEKILLFKHALFGNAI
jgi:hypothetical protein